jgi:hypothetical protein
MEGHDEFSVELLHDLRCAFIGCTDLAVFLGTGTYLRE